MGSASTCGRLLSRILHNLLASRICYSHWLAAPGAVLFSLNVCIALDLTRMSVATDFRLTTPAVFSSLAGGGTPVDSSRTQNSFALVTQNLLNLGSIPIDRLAESPKADLEGFDLPFLAPHLELHQTTAALPPGPAESPSVIPKEESSLSSTMQHVASLYQTCQQAFGNSEALKFEFLEEYGPNRESPLMLR